MDNFFSKELCDRCGKSLKGNSRIMSMFNTDCICLECKSKETRMPEYRYALESDRTQVKQGNYNFEGIGLGGIK